MFVLQLTDITHSETTASFAHDSLAQLDLPAKVVASRSSATGQYRYQDILYRNVDTP
jgi:hypothetical protein